MLSSKNRPELLVFTYSQPQKVLVAQYMEDHKIHQTALIHYVAAYNTAWHVISQKKELGPVNVSDFLRDSTLNYTRTFNLMAQQPGEHLIFSAQIKNFDQDSLGGSSGIPTQSHKLMAASCMIISPPLPLSTDTSRLVMSDPVIGYQKVKQSMNEDTLFVPFYVPPQNNIAYGKSLWLHYEIYHLHPNSSGITRYHLHYSLDREKLYHPQKGEKLGKTNASLDLTMRAAGSRARQDLENRVENFVPGLYRLTLSATDMADHRQATRHVQIRILRKVRN